MKTYVEPGEVLAFTAPAGGVVSGGLYLIGSLVVVATVDAAAGEKFSAFIGEGVVTAPKVAGVIAEGQKLYWDNAAKNVTGTVGTNTLIGVAAALAGSTDPTVSVRLDGVAR